MNHEWERLATVCETSALTVHDIDEGGCALAALRFIAPELFGYLHESHTSLIPAGPPLSFPWKGRPRDGQSHV